MSRIDPRSVPNLAQLGQAPAAFAKVDRNGVPRRALLVSIAALLCGVLLNYLVPERVFVWVTAISTFGAVWTWAIIVVTQISFRRGLSPAERKVLAFRMPFWPYGSYIALAFLALVVALMAYFPDTRVALYVGPGWLVLLTVCYYALDMRSRGPVSYRA